MILTCCCCYPGACACPQSQYRRDEDTGNIDTSQSSIPWYSKLNILGSIGIILSGEWPTDQVNDPLKECGEEDVSEDVGYDSGATLTRRRRIRY